MRSIQSASICALTRAYGRVVSTSQQSTVRTRWLLQTPDESTGESTGFELTLDINRRADFRYVDN